MLNLDQVNFDRAVSPILALQFILSVLQLLDAFHVVYFPMIHRATVKRTFSLGFSLTPALLLFSLVILVYLLRSKRYRELLVSSLALVGFYMVLEASVAAVSLVLVVVALLSSRRFQGFFFWLFALLAGFEGLALVHWVLLPFGVASPLAWFADLELSLFYVEAYLAPLLVLPLMFMWILKPIAEWELKKNIGVKIKVQRERRGLSPRVLLFLGFSLSLAVVAALYPYGEVVNPEGRSVGVDIPDYVEAALVVEGNPSQAFSLRGGAWPLIFLAIFWFQRIIGSDVSFAVRFLPVVLNPLLVVSMFFLALEVFRDDELAGWAAFFTVCGFQVTVGMYSYFLANMLGLALIFFSLGFLFKALRRDCRVSLVLACLFGGLLVFTHPWTLDQYVAAVVLAAGVMWVDVRGRGGDYEDLKKVLFFLASLGFAEALKVLVMRGVGSVWASSSVVRGVSGLSEFWFDSIFSFRLLYGGLMSVVVLVGLAVFGVYVWGRRDVPGVVFTAFMAVSSLLFLVGDETIKSRLLYNVPVGLFAAVGFSCFLEFDVGEGVERAFVLWVSLSLVVFLFRSLANLV